EFYALGTIHAQLVDRVTAGMRSGQLPPAAGSLIRLFFGESAIRRAEIALELAGPDAVMRDPALRSERDIAGQFIARQGRARRGGRTEMARNIISERLLGMPRGYAADRDVPFSQVQRGR